MKKYPTLERHIYFPEVPGVFLNDPFADSVRNQRSPHKQTSENYTPCCVSCAICTAMEILYYQQNNIKIHLSELYHYYITRMKYHTGIRQDIFSGIRLYHGMKAAHKYGIIPHQYHPYPPHYTDILLPKFAAITPANSLQSKPLIYIPAKRAKNRFTKYYSRVNSMKKWKQSLNNGYPVILNFRITPEYLTISTRQPCHGSKMFIGNRSCKHVVAVVGYSDINNCFLIKDSVGSSFGKNGFWWLNYNLVKNFGEYNFMVSSYQINGVKTK